MIFLISIAIIFTILGIILTLLIEWHYFNSFLSKQPQENVPDAIEKCLPRFKLPKDLREALSKHESSSTHFDGCVVLNLFFQFLYKELKDTKKVRRWFMKKLSVEFEELLQKTTIGRFIDQITLKDLILGTEFPLIKDIRVSNIQLHESKDYIQELDILMNLEYSGGFQLAVNADLVWGRSAFLAVQITRLNGTVRLQLTRQPFTHWSIAFCQEPVLDFKVESQFQGHPVPQITSLIISQIRRVIKKKHTLPDYKVRFKPFFEKPTNDVPDVELQNVKPLAGRLEVSVIECSRLFKTCEEPKYYCTLAIDVLSWSEQSVNDSNAWVSFDFEIIKLPLQSLGIVCKQEIIPDKGKQYIIIENVITDSPASQVDIRKGDVVVTINGAKITSLNQITKILKQSNTKYTIRVERLSLPSLHTSRSHESLSKVDEQVLSLKDVETNLSTEVMDDFLKIADESESSTTCSRTPVQGSPVKKMLLTAHSGIFHKQKGNTLLEVIPDQKERRKSEGSEQLLKSVQSFEKQTSGPQTNIYEEPYNRNVNTKITSLVKGNPDPVWEEKVIFEAETKHKYLNVGVWSRGRPEKIEKTSKLDREFKFNKDFHIGQASILLSDIATECTNNSQGFHQQTFQLKPPELKPVASRFYKLASHPGFDENLCYGDITLVFIYKSQDISTGENQKPIDTSPIPSESEDNDSSSGDNVKERENLETRAHEFSGTQFKTGTACHLCGKKIWLKVAFQCKNCGMISHKKCVAKCHSFTMCTDDGAKLLPKAADFLLQQNVKNPQIITTGVDAADYPQTEINEPPTNEAASFNDPTPTPPGSPKTSRRSIPSLLANLASTAAQAKSGLIRAGSAHNLAPPSQHYTTHSKSLPPSPQYSPLTSRKTSLQGNPFPVADDSDLTDEDVAMTVQRLLQHPNDEMQISAAKEMGRELYAGLGSRDRKAKLNAMVKKVQSEIDAESINRNDLVKCDRQSSDPVVKTKLAFQIAKSDERSRALAVLLLHYFAGIQHCQEMEEIAKTKENVANGIENDSEPTTKCLTENSLGSSDDTDRN